MNVIMVEEWVRFNSLFFEERNILVGVVCVGSLRIVRLMVPLALCFRLLQWGDLLRLA